jgi:lipopolysaccharide export system permease protein
MSTAELNAFLDKERAKGRQGLSEYELEKHRRTSAPFSAFILSIIGACIAHKKVRGGNGMHLALGLIISAGYIVFMQFSTTFAVKGNLSPLMAVWLPNIVFAVVALFIYQRARR